MQNLSTAFELVGLRGGGVSIRSLAHGETMHIGTNPQTEALELHIRQQRLAERVAAWDRTEPFVIWDIGLGPAGNALTAIEELRGASVPVELHSFEISLEVLEFALAHAESLRYLVGWERVVGELLKTGEAQPFAHLRWVLHQGDFSREASSLLPKLPAPSAIFFDPYSPARNIEMWNLETFRALWRAVSVPGAPPCQMTNYTRSTAVRVTMALAGWFVGAGVSTGEKSETTIVANRFEMLENPLGAEWLRRVRSSTNAAPIRGRNYERGPIAQEELALLNKLPQFVV